MNENIGAKGGTNDRKRSFKILKRNKQKLSKIELEALEKRVKKIQLMNIITLVPIAIVGTVTATITGITVFGERKLKKSSKETEELPKKIEEINPKENKEQIKIEKEVIVTKKRIEITPADEDLLNKEISKIKSKKIIENYEERLKELRYKLRNSYYEKDILDEAKYLENNPSEENLKKINKLIDSLDEYKKNINVNDKLLVEDNYINELVNEDIKKIKEESNLLEETKADLLISIDNKVDEIKKIESNIKEIVEQKKAWKNIDEEKLDNLKEKDQEVDKYKNEFIKFQDEQDKINRIVQEKLKKEVNIFERDRIQLSGMSIGSNLAIRNVRRSMRPPGVRSGRRVFNVITTYLFYFKVISSVKPIKNRYKKIDITKYKKEVETSLEEIDKVLKDITKTSNMLNKTISEFTKKYERYSNTKEFKKILDNLEQMQRALKEKEYEIQKIKEEQQKKYQDNLEQAKVYKL